MLETLVNTGGYGWLRLKAIFLLFLFIVYSIHHKK